jgi:hypothetical protein
MFTQTTKITDQHQENSFSDVDSHWGKLRLRLLSLDIQEASFEKRGFLTNNYQRQADLEKIGQTFLWGYHTAIALDNPVDIINSLQNTELELQGFAFEGAAMGLTLLDWLMPWTEKRIPQFLNLQGDQHIYMVYVGLGWALARIPWSLGLYLTQLENYSSSFPDSLLGWLALDGYGFHQGYFAWRKYIEKQKIPHELNNYARNVFDQGLGRSLWFVKGANVDSIVETIQGFAPQRQADLWSGIGLACTYAGGLNQVEIVRLKKLAGKNQSCLAQGSAFAAKTRLRANNPNENTEIASQVLCGMSVSQAALVTDESLKGLNFNSEIPAYEQWRTKIQLQFQ